MDARIEPGDGYRLLRDGEVIAPGDEFFSPTKQDWMETTFSGHAVGCGACKFTYRRKDAPIDPGPEYYLLTPSTQIKVGDEYYSAGKWQPTGFTHGFSYVDGSLPYRRKMPQFLPTPAPAGLKPRNVARAERLHDVRTAIKRQVAAKLDVPHEWLAEYLELAHDDFMMTL